MSIARLEHQVAMPTGGSDGSRRLRVVHGRQEVNLPAAERAAEHRCMSMRRVQARGSLTSTSGVHGVLRENAASRQEFFMLARDD